MSQEARLKRLISSLQLLAADPEIQLSVFPDFVCKPDEIVLTFHDGLGSVPDLAHAGLLPADVVPLLQDIDQLTDDLSDGDSAVRSEEAVRKDIRWVRLRELAVAALRALGESPRQPELDWLTFIPGDPEGEERREL